MSLFPAVNEARRVALSVTVNGIDVSGYISPDLKEFSFKDAAKDKADEIQFALVDKEEKWQGQWFITKGMPVVASATYYNWYHPGELLTLPMGKFVVDEVELSGPPDIIKVKAVSASKMSALSEEQKTRGWESYTLEKIAQEIAKAHNYTLVYDAPAIPFNRIDQREASDLTFLSGLAKGYGINLKVHNGQIILFGAKEWDAKKPRLSIHKKGESTSPSTWSFKESSQGTFKEAEVTYHDPARRATVQESTKAQSAPSGQALTLRQRTENSAQAIAMTRGALRSANEKEKTGSLEWMGCPLIASGITLTCSGWGQYDGIYFVEEVEHKYSTSGTTTRADLRKTLSY